MKVAREFEFTPLHQPVFSFLFSHKRREKRCSLTGCLGHDWPTEILAFERHLLKFERIERLAGQLAELFGEWASHNASGAHHSVNTNSPRALPISKRNVAIQFGGKYGCDSAAVAAAPGRMRVLAENGIG